MMKSQNKKRGFTIIELVIVVTVIAILSAVLIPTFAGVIKRANLSADEQAVRTINLELAAADDEDLASLEKVEAYLAGIGLTIEDYAPVSKNYRLAYSASLKKVVLVDNANKVVYPKEYANENVVVEKTNEDKVITEIASADDIALVAMSRGGEVSIPTAGLAVDTAIYLTKNTTVALAGEVKVANDTVGDGVFCVKKGTLTLDGEGTVNGVGDNNYCMAVWADGGEVVINSGTYTNKGAVEKNGTGNNYEVIYVKNGGKVTINGGTFIGAYETKEDNKYLLNSHDTQVGTIEVKGGKFYKYNPETDANDATIYVAEGYKVVQDGDWYEVVKA